MSWLDVFQKAQPVGVDSYLVELEKRRVNATSILERMEIEEATYEHFTSARAPGSSLILHPIPNRFIAILKIPELPDPNLDFFI